MDDSKNLNLLQNKNFTMIVDRLPFVNYFCTHIAIPDISSTSAIHPNPFVTAKVPGDHLDFSPLTATFNVDEDLRNWEEIYKWMESYGFPESGSQYGNPNLPRNQLAGSKFSDIVVQTYTNHYNQNIEWVFKGAYPTNLSGLDFSIQNLDVPILTCTVTFEYTSFSLNRKKVIDS